MSEEKKHAKFSPSAAKRWLHCPASIRLSELAPPSRDSDFAKEGTQAHACLEMMLKNLKNPLAAFDMAKKTYGLQMAIHAQAAVSEILKRRPKGAEILAETKADLSFIDPAFYGTADVSIVDHFGTLHVADYKYGQGIVVEPLTEQLIAYALGIAHKYDYNFDGVNLTIIQPRAQHVDGPIRSHFMPMAELISWRDKFAAAIKECKNPNAKTCAGEWCRFCPAAPTCPELSTKALKEAAIEFDEVSGDMTLPALPNTTAPINLERLGKALTALDRLDDWAKAVRQQARDLLDDGVKVPGWKLVEGRGRREWANEDKTAKEAQKQFGTKAFTAPELLSVAQLEKVAGKKWVDERATLKHSGLTMVPESDKRQATNQIEKDFGGK